MKFYVIDGLGYAIFYVIQQDKNGIHESTLRQTFGIHLCILLGCLSILIYFEIAEEIIRARKQRKKARKFNMIHELNHFEKKEKDRYRGEGIFIKSIVDFEYDVRNRVNTN